MSGTNQPDDANGVDRTGNAEHRPETYQANGSVTSAIKTLKRLIAFPSVSATSNLAINDWCADQLSDLGFSISRSEYCDRHGVAKSNLVAIREPSMESQASSDTGLAYFCHTDVVPAQKWIGQTEQEDEPNPFCAHLTQDRIYGRGACDMKGSLSAMLAAVQRVDPSDQTAPIWVVCTADEEVGFEGAKHMVKDCAGYRNLVLADPVSIIGEPTELEVVHAHKGIAGFKVHSHGRAGHSATNYGINANEAMVPMLVKLLELCQRTRSDTRLHDVRFDPPTLSWNFGVSDHSHVINITPERCDAWVSIRTMPGIDASELIDEADATAQTLGLTLSRFQGCDPVWSDPDQDFIKQLQSISGTESKTVCYATDGGVLNELSRRVVFGPGSINQAHTVDEWISISQLERGIDCYEKAIRLWCTH